MKITLTEFVTLDGVSQGPGSPEEDTTGGFACGGWLVPYLDETFVQRTSEWLDVADGLLFGRRTYEAFARDWPEITDPADPYTERMNTLPKYVVTNTLTEGAWHPTTVLTGDPVHSVAELKARPGRELQIHGSACLGDALLSAGLIDVLRLAVAPVVLRTGRRFLSGPGLPSGLRLVRHEATPKGLLLLEYEPTDQVPQGEYEGVTDFV
ncbi:dihydrofolate reductase family protein [Actinoalloteichus hymeniacidonis]|uniref:Dihydrofolate reductase n=1 Tax=Actinoalloteichus hymeniacidonis TaxID=340345 RepID=A0AAC9HMW8_9PSEU|nr:dihydrofolate reductase family protein [Actinoalloteichus hymeniacidonis]AOS62185.1 dihydrofolate reductase [Actinoalloteichus hymeniacidonis]MBB5909790.1 dihydrofolate reductase [Actinoalloteichus hymeniacidonis]